MLVLRRELRERSDLGDWGACAIHRELVARGEGTVPSVRTIGRILERRGALDGGRRTRRPAPPTGWYLPDVADGTCELDSLDIVEGLRIRNGPEVEVLTAISLHGALVDAWPAERLVSTDLALQLLERRWRAEGLPAYAQFDNDTIFQGPHNRPDVIGRVTRFCLQLGVTPVFAPKREPGFQASIESFNGRWQQKVWARFHHESLQQLRERSDRYIAAARQRGAERIANAPPRRNFPADFSFDPAGELRRSIVFLRRANANGVVRVNERDFEVDTGWTNRLVRACVDLDEHSIAFYALRRKDHAHQALLAEMPYRIPRRKTKKGDSH